MRTTGILDEATDFVLAPNAQRLVVWFHDRVETYEAGPGADWTPSEHDFGVAVDAADYDHMLEAFVAVTWKGGRSRINVTPVDGSSPTEASFTVPPGHEIESVAVGSGRSFALTRVEGGHELVWWDSLTGAYGGSHAVGNARDGMRTSSNGRLLALWNLDAWSVTLVDTAAPEQLHYLRLGICRAAGPTEASADGRWFLFGDCMGNLRLADLAAPDLTSRAIGVKHVGEVRFAADTPEVVWLDTQGTVYSFNAITRVKEVLLQLSGSELDGFDPWYADVFLDRSSDLLAVTTGRGTVRIQNFATPTVAIEVPRLVLSGATLDLTAKPIDPAGANYYEFAGSFAPLIEGAAGEVLPLTGTVSSDRLHEYLPSSSELSPAALGPPRLSGYASVSDAFSADEQFTLSFATTDRRTTSFSGDLYDVLGAVGYRVVVERIGAAH